MSIISSSVSAAIKAREKSEQRRLKSEQNILNTYKDSFPNPYQKSVYKFEHSNPYSDAVYKFENRNPYNDAVYKFEHRNDNNVKYHTEKRGMLDRVFSMLGYGGIVEGLYNLTDDDENTTFGQGLVEGFKYMNPFEDDVTQRNTFSDVLENLGWEDNEDGKPNIGRGIAGFVGDVLLDPLTFLNPYASAGKVLKGTGVTLKDVDKVRKAVKAAEVSGKIQDGVDVGSKINKLANITLDDAKKIVRENNPHYTNQEVESEAIKVLDGYASKVIGLRDSGQGEGFSFGLNNAVPFAERIKVGDRTLDTFSKEFFSAEAARSLGDKTIAPYVNSLLSKIKTSNIASRFSRNNEIARIAKKEGDAKALDVFYFDYMKKGNDKAARNIKDINVADSINKFFEEHPDISQEEFILNYDKGVYTFIKETKIKLIERYAKLLDENDSKRQYYMNVAESLKEELDKYKQILDGVYKSCVDEVAKKNYTNADELLAKRKTQREKVLNDVGDFTATEIDMDVNHLEDYTIDELVSSLRKKFSNLRNNKSHLDSVVRKKMPVLSSLSKLVDDFEARQKALGVEIDDAETAFLKAIYENEDYEARRSILVDLDREISIPEHELDKFVKMSYEEASELIELKKSFELQEEFDKYKAMVESLSDSHKYLVDDNKNPSKTLERLDVINDVFDDDSSLYAEREFNKINTVINNNINDISTLYGTSIDKLTPSQKRQSYEIFSKLQLYSMSDDIDWKNILSDYAEYLNLIGAEGAKSSILKNISKSNENIESYKKMFLGMGETEVKKFINYMDMKFNDSLNLYVKENFEALLGEFSDVSYYGALKGTSRSKFSQMTLSQKVAFIHKFKDNIERDIGNISGKNKYRANYIKKQLEYLNKYLDANTYTFKFSDDDIATLNELFSIKKDVDNHKVERLIRYRATKEILKKYPDKSTIADIDEYLQNDFLEKISKIDDEKELIRYLRSNYEELANDENIINLEKYLDNIRLIKELPEQIEIAKSELLEIQNTVKDVFNSPEYIEKMEELRKSIVNAVNKYQAAKQEILYLKPLMLKIIDDDIDKILKNKSIVEADMKAESEFIFSQTEAHENILKFESMINRSLQIAAHDVIDDISIYLDKEMSKALNEANIVFDHAFELENDNGILELYNLISDRMIKSLNEELMFANDLKNSSVDPKRYIKRILSDEAKAMIAEPLFYETGKFNPSYGVKDKHSKTRKFATMEEGENWFRGAVREQARAGLIEQGMSEKAAETYVDMYFDDDSIVKLYKYNVADLYLERAIGSNEILYSNKVNNFVKNKLCTVYDGKVTKDRVVASYIDVSKSMRKRYYDTFGENASFAGAKKYEKEAFEKAGFDYELIGNNTSFFDLTVEQKKILDEYCYDKNLVVMYNMDDYIYNRYNMYTKDQMNSVKSGMMRLFDTFQNHWKLLNTVVNPGFHIQNLVSNAFQSFLGAGADAFNPAKLKRAYSILSTKDPKQFATLNGKKYSYKELSDIIREYGVVDNTFFKEEISSDMYKFLPYKAGAKVGSSIEGMQRVNLFLSFVDQGKSFEEAVEGVNKFLFDYGELTEFEKSTMRRILPFYTFMRKNIPLMLEQMFIEQPNTFNTLNKGITNIEKMNDDYIDENYRNPYRQDYIQLPFSIGENEYGDVQYGISNQLPYTQLDRVFDLQKLAGQASPLIKAPIELATGTNIYTGIPTGNIVEYLVQQFPFSKIPYNAIKSKEKGTERNLYILGQLAGFSINQIKPMTYYEDYGDYWEDMFK